MARSGIVVGNIVGVLLLAAGASAQRVLAQKTLLDGSRFASAGYFTFDNTTFNRDTSNGDLAGLAIDLHSLWSMLGQRFSAPQDWTNYNAAVLQIENTENYPVRVAVRLETSPDIRAAAEQQLVVLPALQSVQVQYDFDTSAMRAIGVKSLPPAFDTQMLHLGPNTAFNSSSVYGWQIFNKGTQRTRIRLWDFRLLKVNPSVPGVVDPFGQSAFGTWAGKVASIQDFAIQRVAEDTDLTNNPGPGELQGSNLLSRLSPSTKWRTLKRPSGKWYLVHPTGRMFWSMGMDTMRNTEGTLLTGRSQLFQQLPGRSEAGSHYEYVQQNGQTVEMVDFTSANLEAKYGPSWGSAYATTGLRRLKSWGFNSIGGWADPLILAHTDAPFVLSINSNEFPRRLPTTVSSRTLPDPFDATFAGHMANRLAVALQGFNGRPEMMGVYVDIELPWGQLDNARTRYAVAFATLNAPESQPAKRAFVSMLRRKYSSVSRLNRSWGTTFSSWRAVTDPGQSTRAALLADCRQFVSGYATQYFKAVKSAFAATNCSGLYLGSREGWQSTPEVQTAANRYVDVFSMGIYERAESVDWSFGAIDKPIIVSEFSFGATDRGMWHTGAVSTMNQADRAEHMGDFFLSALRANKVVGAHWFQYGDQHFTGRFDGENYNMGFLSITDTPYPELVAASRSIGAGLYSIRGN